VGAKNDSRPRRIRERDPARTARSTRHLGPGQHHEVAGHTKVRPQVRASKPHLGGEVGRIKNLPGQELLRVGLFHHSIVAIRDGLGCEATPRPGFLRLSQARNGVTPWCGPFSSSLSSPRCRSSSSGAPGTRNVIPHRRAHGHHLLCGTCPAARPMPHPAQPRGTPRSVRPATAVHPRGRRSQPTSGRAHTGRP
jgi:hypothetical protein